MNTDSKKEQNEQCTIPVVMGSLFLLLLNTGGTIVWISLYNSGRFTEWWVFALIIVCGLAALLQLPKLYKWVRCFF